MGPAEYEPHGQQVTPETRLDCNGVPPGRLGAWRVWKHPAVLARHFRAHNCGVQPGSQPDHPETRDELTPVSRGKAFVTESRLISFFLKARARETARVPPKDAACGTPWPQREGCSMACAKAASASKALPPQKCAEAARQKQSPHVRLHSVSPDTKDRAIHPPDARSKSRCRAINLGSVKVALVDEGFYLD